MAEEVDIDLVDLCEASGRIPSPERQDEHLRERWIQERLGETDEDAMQIAHEAMGSRLRSIEEGAASLLVVPENTSPVAEDGLSIRWRGTQDRIEDSEERVLCAKLKEIQDHALAMTHLVSAERPSERLERRPDVVITSLERVLKVRLSNVRLWRAIKRGKGQR